jgi:hypothetical protein
MYRKMLEFPHLIPDMRRIFVSVLAERGIKTDEEIVNEAKKRIAQETAHYSVEELQEYIDSLIDLYFAWHFDDEEIENHINLARKQESFKNLTKIVNTEGATSKRIKRALQDFCEIPEGKLYMSPNETEGIRVALINHFISNQLPFIGIAKKYITIRDVDEMLDHSYWNRRRPGRIGGKAAGMFLAYKVILPRLTERDPELERYVAIPDSYYFNSGIFSDFIDYNGLYQFHTQKYKTRETIEEEYQNIAQLFRQTSFPPDVIDDFRGFLEQVGEDPLILRSSSLLEDNFGYAFSGKYDSVFIANQGDLETRLKEFMWGLKQVHMSTYGPAPIMYRKEHNLLDFDERMGVLAQKVVGRRFGDYFFPFSAGVAFSHNSYTWNPRIKKEEGLVRLVFGLGTRAVDRVGQDYPRMIPLSHPNLRPEIGVEQIKKFSPRMVDVLNLKTKCVEAIPFLDLSRQMSHPDLYYAVSLDEEGHLSPPMFRTDPIDIERSCLTFDNLLDKTPFVGLMKKILRKLEDAYGHPVDVEFAWDNDTLYLLQCRTLSVAKQLQKVSLPDNIDPERVLFTNDQGVSNGMVNNIEYIVYVDPRAYGQLRTMEDKLAIGKVVSRLNRVLEGKRYILLGPGRWGSNDINLGVRVGYEDINRTLILGEIAFDENESAPEVSYGTHFFNDLVEAEIIPVAIYPDQDGTTFNERFLLESPNQLKTLVPDCARHEKVVHLLHLPSCNSSYLLQVYQDGEEQKGVAILEATTKSA